MLVDFYGSPLILHSFGEFQLHISNAYAFQHEISQDDRHFFQILIPKGRTLVNQTLPPILHYTNFVFLGQNFTP